MKDAGLSVRHLFFIGCLQNTLKHYIPLNRTAVQYVGMRIIGRETGRIDSHREVAAVGRGTDCPDGTHAAQLRQHRCC